MSVVLLHVHFSHAIVGSSCAGLSDNPAFPALQMLRQSLPGKTHSLLDP